MIVYNHDGGGMHAEPAARPDLAVASDRNVAADPRALVHDGVFADPW